MHSKDDRDKYIQLFKFKYHSQRWYLGLYETSVFRLPRTNKPTVVMTQRVKNPSQRSHHGATKHILLSLDELRPHQR